MLWYITFYFVLSYLALFVVLAILHSGSER